MSLLEKSYQRNEIKMIEIDDHRFQFVKFSKIKAFGNVELFNQIIQAHYLEQEIKQAIDYQKRLEKHINERTQFLANLSEKRSYCKERKAMFEEQELKDLNIKQAQYMESWTFGT